LCIEGNRLLYDFCAREGVKHLRCGKLIVSTNAREAEKISSIYDNAKMVGVPGLKLLTKEDIKQLEPDIYALNGIYSGSTGIIDSHKLMSVLYRQAQETGVMFSFSNEVIEIAGSSNGYIIKSSSGDEVASEIVINCAGLGAENIARMAGFDIKALGYALYPCKGDYFSMNGPAWKLRHLVYPVPHEEGYGLGVHATLDLNGGIRLGPDANYVEKIEYDVDPNKRKEFFQAARTYLPWIRETDLSPDTSGIRPKLQGPGQGFRDFVIKEESGNGYPGFINLLGIESPGLTSCLAIGQYAAGLIND
jgi:L-2-hydroxyglutarate oxidase LhgO